MSELSLRRMCELYLADLPTACAEGRGEALLHDFLKDLSIDFAESVFLVMEDTVRKASPEDAAALWDWCNEFPHRQRLALVESVTSTFQQFDGAGVGLQLESAQQTAATAYGQRLEALMEISQAGGSA